MLTKPFLWLVSQHIPYYLSYCVRDRETHLCWVSLKQASQGWDPSRGFAGLISTSTIAHATVGTVEFPKGS